MSRRAAIHTCILLSSVMLASGAYAQDKSVEVTLTDDLKPNPLVFSGQIAAPIRLKDLGQPLNRNNDQCRHIDYVDVPRVPQVVLTLQKPKRVSITGMPDLSMNPAAYVVKDDRRNHWCADSVSRGTDFLLPAGRFFVYFAPRAVSKKYSFKIGDESRPGAVAEAPTGTPAIVVAKSFRPNPQVFRPNLPETTAFVRDAVFNVRCGDAVFVSEQPSFTLQVDEDHTQQPLVFYGSDDFILFDRTTGKAACVAGTGTSVAVSAGTHYAYQMRGRRRGETPWLAVRDAARPLQIGVAAPEVKTTALPEKLDKPLVVSGTATAARHLHPLVRGRCQGLGDAPDFFLRTSAPLADARIQVLGATGALRLVGPLDEEGRLQGSVAPAPASPGGPSARRDRTRRHRMRAERVRPDRGGAKGLRCLEGNAHRDSFGISAPQAVALDGLYAVYVTGDGNAALPYALRVFQEKTEREPMQRALEPAADAPVAARVLDLWYPDVRLPHRLDDAESRELVHRFWMDVPRSVVLFLRTEAERSRLKVGTALLLLSLRGENAEVMTATGSRATVPVAALDTKPPRDIASPELDKLELTESTLSKYLAPKPQAALEAMQKKFRGCYDRALDKLDPDGKAGRYDIVTYRAGRIVKVEGMAAKHRRIAGQRCGEKAYDDRIARMAKKVSAAQEKLQAQRVEEVRARLQGLLRN